MSPIDTSNSVRTAKIDTDTSTRRSGQSSPSGESAGSGAAGAAGSAESLSLTRAAEELNALETRLRELPRVDEARVAELRESIESGSYQVDSQRIADRLIATERDLG
ncbi:MAG: flagellar biosynthesis anti-sigma factor FlgM [Pseudomonadota bacterium]